MKFGQAAAAAPAPAAEPAKVYTPLNHFYFFSEKLLFDDTYAMHFFFFFVKGYLWFMQVSQ